MPASRNSLDQRAISSPADLNFPQLLLQQGAECSGSSGFSFISDCCPSLSPRREKSGLGVFDVAFGASRSINTASISVIPRHTKASFMGTLFDGVFVFNIAVNCQCFFTRYNFGKFFLSNLPIEPDGVWPLAIWRKKERCDLIGWRIIGWGIKDRPIQNSHTDGDLRYES